MAKYFLKKEKLKNIRAAHNEYLFGLSKKNTSRLRFDTVEGEALSSLNTLTTLI